jgi:hypothetical protein
MTRSTTTALSERGYALAAHGLLLLLRSKRLKIYKNLQKSEGGSGRRRQLPDSALLAVRRGIQNEVLQRCVIPAKAAIQSRGTRGRVWMPAFARFRGHDTDVSESSPILNDSGE